MTPILVTGGTGTLGRAVVAELTARGHDVRVLSRRTGTDLVTGRGLGEALRGADTVLHLATTLRGRRDVVATRNLVDAAPDVGHLLFVSIAGIDRIPLGYYRGKLAAERLVAQRPHTVLRTTQFHDLIRTLLAGAAKLPIMPVPAVRAQPIDVRDVATLLADLAAGAPRGRVPDVGGPETKSLRELADDYLRAVGERSPMVSLSFPGKVFRGYREGAHLVPGNPAGTITFTEYLAS
ncbi:SDR family oxidoreductase [Actinophytocola sp. NPDC049390]|uniref:SDR family oxidoreductase n=1 Tax=Actinophytocola sp. NPDC049390 TaxID=3363894 RepID=UPI0037B45A0E